MKGEVDIFLIGLAIGIIVIVGAYLSVLWKGVHFSVGTPREVIESSPSNEPSIMEFPPSGLVGESPELAAIRKDYGIFNISYMDSFDYFGNYSGDVKNGLLYGKNVIEFGVQIGLDDVSSAWVVFNVKKSNRYGKLVVVVNNCTISDVVLYPGHYEYPVPLSCLSNLTAIKIEPRSSGWRLWAPTYYSIEDASLKVSRYYSRPAILRFSLDSEQYNNFQEANLLLNFLYYSGEIRVVVNGREVYSGEPDDQMVINIYHEDVRKGDNEIKIYASKNSESKGRAILEITYSEVQPHKVQQDFYVDGKTMDALKDGGYVSFYVSQIYRPGGISVKIYDRTGKETFSKYLDLHTGLYNVPINSNDVRYGRNSVEINGVDGGLFEVTGIQVIG